MSFDLSKWASQSLAKIEGTLDQAFGLDSGEPQQPAPSLPSAIASVRTDSEQKPSNGPVPDQNSQPNLGQDTTNSVPEKSPAVSSNENSVIPDSIDAQGNESVSENPPIASESFLRSLLDQRERQCKAQSDQLVTLHAEKLNLEMLLSEAKSVEEDLRASIKSLAAKESADISNELQRTKTQLQDLLLEGEQWSKKQMKLESIVKTLRTGMKAKEAELSGLRTDITSKTSTIQALTDKCQGQEDTEKGLLDQIATLTAQLNDAKAQLERVQRESVLMDKETAESVAVTERLEAKLKAQQIEASHWKVAFDEQAELQARISVMQDQLKEGEIRELTLRRNVIDLSAEVKSLKDGSDEEKRQLRDQLQQAREQLNEAFFQNEQLRREVPLATLPLLKQIETLQASLKTQTEKLQSTEAKLLLKLANTEKKLQERSSSMQSIKNDLKAARKENEELRPELDEVRKQNEHLKLEIIKLKNTTDSLRADLNLKQQEYETLHQQLIKTQKDAHDASIKLKEQISSVNANASSLQKELEEARSALSQVETALSQQNQESKKPISVRRQHSKQFSDSSIETPNLSEGKNSVFAYNMSVQLRRQEAELTSLRERLAEVEKERDLMTEKLVEASVRSSSDSEANKELREQLDALKMRHDIALNIIGEKSDQVDELTADLRECKSIFKEQLEELMRQLETARIQNK